MENTCVEICSCNFIKQKLKHRCFPVNIAKFLRTTFCIVFFPLVYTLPNKLSLNWRFIFEIIISRVWLPTPEIRALLRIPYSVQQCVLLEMPYLEYYLYAKLGRSLRGRENLTPAGVQRIQGKCVYPCLTPNVQLRIGVCSAQDALLRIVSIYQAGQIYTGQRKSYYIWST